MTTIIAVLVMDTTFDGLMNKRVWVEQPAEGYRIAVDTVLLAAAVSAKPGDRVLDMGCGVGGVMFCLAARIRDLHLTGIDIQHELIELCRKNIEHNHLQNSATAETYSVTDWTARDYDHIVMNPPFHAEERHSVSDNKIKRTANAEKTGDLPLWLESAARILKPNGILTLIHRADRMDEIIAEGQKYFSEITVLPIIARTGAAPKRIIMRMARGTAAVINICENFILYGDDNRYCAAAEAVIRHAMSIEFKVIRPKSAQIEG